MNLIRSGEIIHDAEEHDMKCRVWKVGKYSEAYKPELLKWAEQHCLDTHNHSPGRKSRVQYSSGGGKKQLEAERQKLILEIENGQVK